jgi:hypothetical protein
LIFGDGETHIGFAKVDTDETLLHNGVWDYGFRDVGVSSS